MARGTKLGVVLFERSDPTLKGILAEFNEVGFVVLVREAVGMKSIPAPSNWLECDGKSISALEYPALSKVLHERVTMDKDNKPYIRLPDLNGVFVYAPTKLDELQLVSMLSCTHELKEALDSPVDDPKAQEAIVELAKSNQSNQRVVAYIRVK